MMVPSPKTMPTILFFRFILYALALCIYPAILLLAASGVSDNKKQKIFPAWKLKSPEKGAQGLIEFLPPPEIRAGFYEVFIA
jgi:hypothetical protein